MTRVLSLIHILQMCELMELAALVLLNLIV